MSAPVGDFAFADDNVYGHALELLNTMVDVSNSPVGSIHLDIACGYARIGDEIERRTGLHYVGLDIDDLAIAAVRARGLEAHSLDLENTMDLMGALEAIIDGRPLASVSFLDSITEVGDPVRILTAVSKLIAPSAAVFIVSSPNITHRDVGFKLALGQYVTTSSGLLDDRHRSFFGAKRLEETLSTAGLHVAKRLDVELTISDQHFPRTHPVLSRSTSLNQFLGRLRASAEPYGRVQQFVWCALSGPARNPEPLPLPDVFLTIVIRTVGRRLQEFSEVLLCLAGQSNQNFEVIILGHNLSVDAQISVESAIEDTPESLRRRISLHRIDYGTRATLLNLGFDLARGEYVTVLDDDDLVFAHWVESFADLADKYHGKILRGVGVIQDATRVAVRGEDGIRAESGLISKFDPEFEYVAHLSQNQSPLMTLAFPIGVYRDLGIRFDETLTTTEDWDYLLRTAPYSGVADSRRVVAIYHRWPDQEASHTDHVVEEWHLNQLAVDRKIDAQPILLPAGETRIIRDLVRSQRSYLDRQRETDNRSEHDWVLYRIASILESTSWRLTAPIRVIARLLGRGRSVRMSDLPNLPVGDLRRILDEIEHSRSWRNARKLTAFRRR